MNEVEKRWRVLADGVVFSFIKHVELFDPFSEEQDRVFDNSDENVATPCAKEREIGECTEGSRTSLYCLHNYDEICISGGHESVRDAIAALKSIPPHRTVSRNALAFRLAGETSGGEKELNYSDLGELQYVILLRISNRLSGKPTLDIESQVITLIRQCCETLELQWIVAHTLAKRELLLVISGSHAATCEKLVAQFHDTKAVQGNSQVAFTEMGVWPSVLCHSKNPEKYFEIAEEAGCAHDCLNGEVAKIHNNGNRRTVAALRVVGSCDRQSREGHVCSFALEDAIRSQVLRRGSGRAILGGRQDHQVHYPAEKRNLLLDVRSLRSDCLERTCSVNIVREVNVLKDDRWLFSAGDLRIETNGKTLWPQTPVHLDAIRTTAGCELIADQIEALRSDLTSLIVSPSTQMEFADLYGFIPRIQTLLANFRDLRHRTKLGPAENSGRDWTKARSAAVYLIHAMERAIAERRRGDLLASPLASQPTLMGASGYSRLAPVGRYSIQQFLEKAAGMRGLGVCLVGPEQDSSQDAMLSIVFAPLSALLEPERYVTLGHEGAHIILEKIGPKEIERRINSEGRRLNQSGGLDEFQRIVKEHLVNYAFLPKNAKERQHVELFTEVFCDAVCFDIVYGKGESSAYLTAWLDRYARLLVHTDFIERAELLRGGVVEGTKVGPKAHEYLARLVAVLARNKYSKLDSPTESAAKEAVEGALDEIESALENLLSDSSPLLQDECVTVALTAMRNAVREFRQKELSKIESLAVYAAAHLVHKILVRDLLKISGESTDDYSTYLDALKAGFVVNNEPKLVLSMLARVAENGTFSGVMGTILSVGHWEERHGADPASLSTNNELLYGWKPEPPSGAKRESIMKG